jgi:hypothetical protein
MTPAEHFLRYYEDALDACSARLGLFTLPEKRTSASRDICSLAALAEDLSQAKSDVYFHIHLHDLPEGQSACRGSSEKVRAAIGVFSDIDAWGPNRKKPRATLCPTVEDAIWIVDEFDKRHSPLKISLVIQSGYGCYPAILFREPLLLEHQKDRELLESIGRRFHAALHAIAAERGWTGAVDYCDQAKVLRLPGCSNWKDPSSPKLVQVVRESQARIDPSELADHLPSVSLPRVESTRGTGEGGRAVITRVAVDVVPELPQGLVARLIESHPRFASTWEHQRDDLNDQSCSGYDLAVADIAVGCELSDQEIADLLRLNRIRFRGKKQERHGQAYVSYLQRTIAKARASAPSTEAPGKSKQRRRPETATPVEGGRLMRDATSAATANVAADPTATPSVQSLLAEVRTTGEIKLVYDNIGMLAALSDVELAATYQSLKCALGSKLIASHFDRAIREARAYQQSVDSDRCTQDPRPLIRTDDRLLDEIAAEAMAALESANEPPTVFRRGGQLVMIHLDEDGRPIIKMATEAIMRGQLARAARFYRTVKGGTKKVSPPEDLTRDVLAFNGGQFPALGVLTQIPILRPDGTIRLDPGYDPTTRAYYTPDCGFKLASIPKSPSTEEVSAAVQLLMEVIEGFPFEAQADRANCIAMLLTPILRVGFQMNAPLMLIDAPKWGTGKTLLGQVTYVLITGSPGTVCPAPTAEEEWRKRMTSILERGRAVVILDNIDQTLRSPSLSAVLTSSYWEDRVLGRSEEVRLPNVSTWIGTGNNVVLGGEMARRVVRIRLDAKVATPAKRDGFKRTEQELLDWVSEKRGELIAALFAIVRAWCETGQPKGDVPAFGSFSNWARQVGGILQHAGIAGFLHNLDQVQQQADEESAQWDQFLRALAMIFKYAEFTVSEVADRALHERGLLAVSFPDDIGHPDERADGGISSLSRRLGKAFGRKCGTRFGELDLRIERGRPDSHTKVQRWKVGGNIRCLLTETDGGSAGIRVDD